MENRIRAEMSRTSSPISRYNWNMFAVIWILQYIDPVRLDRDHFHQIMDELGISEATQRLNPFAQWARRSPDPSYTAHNPFYHTPGARGDEQDGNTTYVTGEGSEDFGSSQEVV